MNRVGWPYKFYARNLFDLWRWQVSWGRFWAGRTCLPQYRQRLTSYWYWHSILSPFWGED